MQLQPGTSISQKQAAGLLHCDPSNVTIVGDRLESPGQVKREIDPADRRGRSLILTIKGKRIRRQLIDRVFKVPDSVASHPGAEQEVLRDILRRIVASA